MNHEKDLAARRTCLAIDAAHQHLDRAVESLQAALRDSDQVSGIVILQLIERAATLRTDIGNLDGAMKQDAMAPD